MNFILYSTPWTHITIRTIKYWLKKRPTYVFHFRNREANRHLKVKWNRIALEPSINSRYLRVTLDRFLSFKLYCMNTSEKISLATISENTMWSAHPPTPHITNIIMFSVAKYSSPVWNRFAHVKQMGIVYVLDIVAIDVKVCHNLNHPLDGK